MEGIQEILNQAAEPLKQKELRESVRRGLDLPDKEIRRLLTHIIHKFFVHEDFGDFWNRSVPREDEYDAVLLLNHALVLQNETKKGFRAVFKRTFL